MLDVERLQKVVARFQVFRDTAKQDRFVTVRPFLDGSLRAYEWALDLARTEADNKDLLIQARACGIESALDQMSCKRDPEGFLGIAAEWSALNILLQENIAEDDPGLRRPRTDAERQAAYRLRKKASARLSQERLSSPKDATPSNWPITGPERL